MKSEPSHQPEIPEKKLEKKPKKDPFLESVVHEAENVWRRRGEKYPTKNEQIGTTDDRSDWIAIAQYIMTNAGQDSSILRKAYGYSVPDTIQFLKSFDYNVPEHLYEPGSKKTSASKNVVGRKTLYQILLGIMNSFQEKKKSSLNQNGLDILFGILDPTSIKKHKDSSFRFSRVINHTRTRTGDVLAT